MVREGVIAVDVGFHVLKDEATGGTTMVGDLDFGEVAAKAAAITPVPGGVGPSPMSGSSGTRSSRRRSRLGSNLGSARAAEGRAS